MDHSLWHILLVNWDKYENINKLYKTLKGGCAVEQFLARLQ